MCSTDTGWGIELKEEFDKLVSEYFDGELDSAGQRRLVDLAESDASKMAMLQEMLLHDRILNFELNAVSSDDFVNSVMGSIRSDRESFVSGVTEDIFTINRRRKWLTVLALAASVMLVAGGLVWQFSGGDGLPSEGKFLMAETIGKVRINGKLISGKDGIYEHGASIETGDRSSARMVLSDGSELKMAENTHMISRDDRNVFIENGILCSRITPRNKGHEAFVVAASEDRSVTVQGTLFETSLIEDIMDVLVRKGTVRVRSGGFYEDVSAVSKISINGKCLMPTRSVYERRSEGGVGTVDDAGVPYVALDEYRDSEVLFTDKFDDGLGFWKPYRFVLFEGGNLLPENLKEDELPDELRIKKTGSEGRTSNVLLIGCVGNEQHGVLMDYAELPVAYSVEYDILPGQNSSIDSFITQEKWKESKNLLNTGNSIKNGKIRSRSKWHRCRAEYVEHVDKQGRRCVEGRLSVDDKPVSHVLHFAERYYPAVLVSRGMVEVDNVVVRKMELVEE